VVRANDAKIFYPTPYIVKRTNPRNDGDRFSSTGNDPNEVGHYHPFYITDSAEGGFGQKDDMEQKKQRVFAGIVYDSDGYPFPTTGIACYYYYYWRFVARRNTTA